MLTKTYELSMVGSGGDAAKQRINYVLFNVFGLCVCINCPLSSMYHHYPLQVCSFLMKVEDKQQIHYF